jgi:hypothetical protein
VELTTISSAYHLELNPSDVGYNDRYVVQEIIKDMARNRPLGVDGNKGFKVRRARPGRGLTWAGKGEAGGLRFKDAPWSAVGGRQLTAQTLCVCAGHAWSWNSCHLGRRIIGLRPHPSPIRWVSNW